MIKFYKRFEYMFKFTLYKLIIASCSKPAQP